MRSSMIIAFCIPIVCSSAVFKGRRRSDASERRRPLKTHSAEQSVT